MQQILFLLGRVFQAAERKIAPAVGKGIVALKDIVFKTYGSATDRFRYLFWFARRIPVRLGNKGVSEKALALYRD